MILLDTNLLGRITDSADPQCHTARQAIQRLLAAQERLTIVPQNLYEFWAVATRKRGPPPRGQNGLGMTCKQADQWLAFFRRRFSVLHDRQELLESWRKLVTMFNITGIKAYDARIVAAMQTYGIARVLTFNGSDFKQFPIDAIDPETV
jgi:predicted nucleic acid-binding protein